MDNTYKEYASKEYVDNIAETLKTEIQGELDEIGDLIGNEEFVEDAFTDSTIIPPTPPPVFEDGGAE